MPMCSQLLTKHMSTCAGRPLPCTSRAGSFRRRTPAVRATHKTDDTPDSQSKNRARGGSTQADSYFEERIPQYKGRSPNVLTRVCCLDSYYLNWPESMRPRSIQRSILEDG